MYINIYTHIYVYIRIYHIAQNGAREKLWQIWQNERNSPIFYPAK